MHSPAGGARHLLHCPRVACLLLSCCRAPDRLCVVVVRESLSGVNSASLMDDIVPLTGRRTSGLLLHPTSLPGRYGIGDLGTSAYQFVDFLVASGQQCWQVLPLGPPDEVYSPYQGASSMAGNTLLLSLDTLMTEGWLTPEVLRDVPVFPDAAVDYEAVIPWKDALLRQAAARCVQALSGTD